MSSVSAPTAPAPFSIRLARLSSTPWFAYGTILLLQLRRMWGIWQFRDISTGDTCGYLGIAWKWFEQHQVNLAWSPLYTAFYGAFLHVGGDVATNNLLHRLAIALAATLLVLAFFRRMLPPTTAWLLAAWWAIMPINFDTMYEVHLFALLPILIAWIVAASGNSPWHRGTACAILLLDAFLMRNEIILAFAFFFCACMVLEMRRKHSIPFPSIVAAYLVPLLAAMLVVGFFYNRSYVKYPALVEEFHMKHAINMGQVYAFGYRQRHPEWKRRPFVDYGELCKQDFGTPLPTISVMLRRNPKACLAHLLWNLRLLPGGLQLMLFSATSSTVDPDYAGINLGARYPTFATVLFLSIIVGGVWMSGRKGPGGFPAMLRDRQTAWLAMLAVVFSCTAVIITQRPRPSYLFGLTIALMTITGVCALLMFARVRVLSRLAPLMPFIMLALPVIVRSSYHQHARPVFDEYQRLKPYARLFDQSSAAFAGSLPTEMCSYMGRGRMPSFGYGIFQEIPAGMSLVDFLDARRITLLELDEVEMSALEAQRPGLVRSFLQTAPQHHWQLISAQDLPSGEWLLFTRSTDSEPGPGVNPDRVLKKLAMAF